MSSSSDEVCLLIYIDPKSERVLFAQVLGKCINLLFKIFRLVGSPDTLNKSIQNLSGGYLLNPELLKPKGHGQIKSGSSNIHACPCCCESYVTDHAKTPCPICRCQMDLALLNISNNVTKVTGSSCDDEEFVVRTVYMVMDDLEVVPLSGPNLSNILDKFNIKDISEARHKIIFLGMEEGIQLVKTSHKTNHALTSFLKNMGD